MRDLRVAYEHPGLGDDRSEDPFAQADIYLVRNVGAILEHHYPGHAWYVEASHKQGVVMINIPALMGQHRYVVKIHELKSDPGMRAIIRGAGEILERFKMPRAAFTAAEYFAALKAQPIGSGYVPN